MWVHRLLALIQGQTSGPSKNPYRRETLWLWWMCRHVQVTAHCSLWRVPWKKTLQMQSAWKSLQMKSQPTVHHKSQGQTLCVCVSCGTKPSRTGLSCYRYEDSTNAVMEKSSASIHSSLYVWVQWVWETFWLEITPGNSFSEKALWM